MKRIKAFFTKVFNALISWLTQGIEDATTNPTSEFEHRLLNQRERYENNKTLLLNLIECETREAEAGYTKWRQISKTEARVGFFLRLLLLTIFLFGSITLIGRIECAYVSLIFLIVGYIVLGGYFLCLYAMHPKVRVENYETHLYYLSTLSALPANEIYENLDKKNPANYTPIFKTQLSQAEICQYFVANFELLQKDKKKYYYKPFVDFITTYIEDKEGNRIKIDSLRSAFSREIASKIY